MKRQKINQKVQDIVRDEQRLRGFADTAEILKPIGALVNAVKVDSEYMKTCIQNLVNSNMNSKNPLNGILTVFGLRLVRLKKSEEFIVSKDKELKNELDSMLKIDEQAFQTAVSEMVSSLAAYEKEKEEGRTDKVSRINELIDRAERQDQEIKRLQMEAGTRLQTIAHWIQSMLGTLGPDEYENTLYEQLSELMQFLDIEAFWNADNGPLSESAMFKEMKVGDISKYKVKPCLICNGEVLAKGVRFCQISG